MKGREINGNISRKGVIPVVSLLLFMIFCFLNATPQTNDTIKVIKENPEKILKNLNIQSITQDGFNFWKDEFSGHWGGIDFGLNTLIQTNYAGYNSEFLTNELIKSYSLYINPIQQSIGLQRNRNTIGLVTGLGIQWLNFRLNKNTTIEESASGKIMPKTLFFDDNQKSILAMFYVTLPLLLEFQFPVNYYENRFFISAGFIGGYRINSSTKIKYRVDKKRENLKTPGDFSMHDFRYGLMSRAGYRNFQIFCSYDLETLFKKSRGPEVTPFTFGITLLRF